MMFAQEAFQRARTFIREHARLVDRRLFDFSFENAPSSGVLEALKAYQNPDGGFGHALEPDARLSASSALHSTVAFHYMRDMNAPADSPLVQDGIRYFLQTYPADRCGWRPLPPEVNLSAHAPWWQVSEEEEPPVLDASGESQVYFANPGAEIVGYLHAYPGLVPPAFLAAAARQALDYFNFMEDPIPPHTFLCYLRMAKELPGDLRMPLANALRQRAQHVVPLQPEEWESGYVLRPHVFAPTPNSLLADLFPDAIRQSLALEVKLQSLEGCWDPNWSWGQYETEWEIARQEWQGYLTVQMLRKLAAWSLIES